jgi:hypothetical protein
MADLLARLKNIESELKAKVDGDLFDNEIASLRELIGNLANLGPESMKPIAQAISKPSGPSISTKDLNRIKEILERFPGLEESQ